ncbi:transposase [Chryseobacterium sp. ES2]|uniref:Transposase n=1 Tax=Chryseobacterium metallicongregator TaxID=3073042 RepID=A0ABU1E728_9FLAO|nr:transposase [Chryseobacterium sp. ES2]MDR4953637.1 transposase [Chryseobacterium sp. ES2]
MSINFKNIHIGSMVKQRTIELDMDISRICNFFKCTADEVETMFLQEDLPTNILLSWSKLLEYDFFRPYSQHLILFSPPAKQNDSEIEKKSTQLPQFRKNIYTREVIDFILELVNSHQKTKRQIIDEYRIPKTTLYKWIMKYNKKEIEE